ncbi:hypothetical protein V1511DRAFT_462034 [Dipodascopsis uninucleata]
MSEDLFLGFDLSTQQIKCIAIDANLKLVCQANVEFDVDTPEYKTKKGVYTNPTLNEVYAPVAMWIKAFDILLRKLRAAELDFSKVRSISGAGQQHGSVYWSSRAEELLAGLDPTLDLEPQLGPEAFSHEMSPNWQDHSTVAECDFIEEKIGGPDRLAEITGSKSHHRFTGPQILRVRHRHADRYEATSRISLVSNFFASLLLGKFAPLDVSDVCGMNLWDLEKGRFDRGLLALVAGGSGAETDELITKLGPVELDGGKDLGNISPYYVKKYGFPEDCIITPITGDNPATILALPLRPQDVIISLGTSTTLLISTPVYKPSPQYHMFNHPTTKGLYMGMLCYCNGALAREKIRDEINVLSEKCSEDTWYLFNKAVDEAEPLLPTTDGRKKLGIYFPLPEIVPDAPAGTWRFSVSNGKLETAKEDEKSWNIPRDDARAILESQNLSMRVRAAPMLSEGKPRRVYVVGGGSRNASICKVTGEVLGPTDGVYKLELGSNACALGSAYKALWSVKRSTDKAGEIETFEDFLASRWDESSMISKVDEGYREGVWENYGSVMDNFTEAEGLIMHQ